jgi:DNA invertase Pin-like site-specific DNA recombinase
MASNEIQKRAAFLVRCSTNKQDYERQIEDLKSVADRFNLSVSEENIFG